MATKVVKSIHEAGIETFKDLLTLKTDMATALPKIGVIALAYARTYIGLHKKRAGSKNNLEKALTFEATETSDGVTVGVGDTDLLQIKAPYWYVFNYGATVTGERYIPPSSFGYFTGSPSKPTSGGKGQKWNYEGTFRGKQYLLKPKKAITGIYYIEATARYIDKLQDDALNKVLRNTR